MIKNLIMVLMIIVLGSSVAWARGGVVRVKSSITKTGTYRPAHMRTTPNRSRLDNWSTKGNVNPYTAKKGTKSLW